MSAFAFRSLVLASVVLGLLGAFVDLIFPSLIPEAIASAAEGLPLSPVYESHWFIGAMIVYAVAMTAATVGLLLFKRWARALCVLGSAISFALFPVLGPSIYSGLGVAIQELSSILWGAVLALAFFSPLRERFRPARNDA